MVKLRSVSDMTDADIATEIANRDRAGQPQTGRVSEN